MVVNSINNLLKFFRISPNSQIFMLDINQAFIFKLFSKKNFQLTTFLKNYSWNYKFWLKIDRFTYVRNADFDGSPIVSRITNLEP